MGVGMGRLKYGNVDTCVYVQDVSNRVAWHYQSLGQDNVSAGGWLVAQKARS